MSLLSKRLRDAVTSMKTQTEINNKEGFSWSLLPEDLSINILSFLSGKELITISNVSRLFYFGATHSALKRFENAFGGRPDASLPRARLFTLVDRSDLIISLYTIVKNNSLQSAAVTSALLCADRDFGMRDLFLWSSMRGYLGMIKKLIVLSNASQSSTSLHALTDSKQPATGATALMLACEFNQPNIVSFLTKTCTVDHTATALNGLNALHICARLGHLEILSYLLELDKSLLGSLVQPDGRTALHLAVCGGHTSIVEKLLKEGVDPDAATTVHDDTGNETSLHIAAYLGHVDIVSLLLVAGANPNIQMRNGRTPLLLACEVGWKDIAMLLLTRSFILPVDISLTTDSGKTALFCVIERGIDDLIEPLLESGSNSLQATRRNKTSFYIAAEKGNLIAAKLLLENADKNGTLVPLVESAKTKVNNKGMKELISLYLSPNGSPRNRARGRSTIRTQGVAEMSFPRSPSSLSVNTISVAASESLVNSAVMAAFVFTGGSGSGLENAASSVLRRVAAAGGGLPRSSISLGSHHNQQSQILPLVMAPAARQQQQQILARQNPSVGGLSAMNAVLAGAGGNTAGEIMIRERARREAEEAEAFLRNAELMEKHRRQAVELAEKARKRLEEKAASEAASEASIKAEAEARKEREEKKRADKDRQIRLDFLKRIADRETKEKALLDTLSTSSPQKILDTTSSKREDEDETQDSTRFMLQPSPKLLASPYAAKIIKKKSGTKLLKMTLTNEEEYQIDNESEKTVVNVNKVETVKEDDKKPISLSYQTETKRVPPNVIVNRSIPKVVDKVKLELKTATFSFSI